MYDGVLLASGGMDLTILSYKLCKEGYSLILLFLDYGQHCAKKELDTLKKVAPDKYKDSIKVINIRDIYMQSESRLIQEANLWEDEVKADDLFLPYRNIFFLSIASAYAQTLGIKNVYSAFINSNHAKEIDCSLEFFNKLGILLEEYGAIKNIMPFRELTKSEVAKIGLSLGVPIAYTYSCQVNSMNPCGVCPNCVDRLEALNNLFN